MTALRVTRKEKHPKVFALNVTSHEVSFWKKCAESRFEQSWLGPAIQKQPWPLRWTAKQGGHQLVLHLQASSQRDLQ